MVRQFWRLLAVAIAALAFSASASAQVVVQGVPHTPAYIVPAPIEAASPYRYNGHLATASRGFVMQSTGNYYGSQCLNGAPDCNNGAGSLAADIGFVLGPTKSFFSPCGPRLMPDCGDKNRGCAKCHTPIYGRGPCGPWPHCTYDSYLNH